MSSSLPLGHGGQYLYEGNGPTIVITLSSYTMEATNEDQGLLMAIRKKDMINIINVIMTRVTIESLEWRLATFLFSLKQKSVQYGFNSCTIRREQ